MKVAFAGSFAVRLAEPVRARLSAPCEVVADDEARIVPQLAEADVLVSMGFSQQMAAAAPRLRLVQVPGAGPDPIDPPPPPPRGRAPASPRAHTAGRANNLP